MGGTNNIEPTGFPVLWFLIKKLVSLGSCLLVAFYQTLKECIFIFDNTIYYTILLYNTISGYFCNFLFWSDLIFVIYWDCISCSRFLWYSTHKFLPKKGFTVFIKSFIICAPIICFHCVMFRSNVFYNLLLIFLLFFYCIFVRNTKSVWRVNHVHFYWK